MRILSSPFEAPRETPPADAADQAREDKVTAISAAEAPAATTDIRPGLDSSTQQSLGRLALLIRDAAVKPVGEKSEETPRDPSQSGESSDGAASENSGGENSQGEEPSLPKPLNPLKAVPPLEESLKDSFPAVVRLEKHLQSASRKRGAKIYGQQKSKDAVQLILSELDRRKAG